MSLEDAIQRAEDVGLDLIEVAAAADPPVRRIADLGKFKFEQDKRARDSKKNQHVSEVKEVRLRPRTDDHDLQVRVRAARRFLEEGHKVKVEVRFRGREATHPEVAREQIRASRRASRTSPSSNVRRRWRGGRCSRFLRGASPKPRRRPRLGDARPRHLPQHVRHQQLRPRRPGTARRPRRQPESRPLYLLFLAVRRRRRALGSSFLHLGFGAIGGGGGFGLADDHVDDAVVAGFVRRSSSSRG